MRDELGCLDHFKANGKEYGFYSLPKLAEKYENVKKLPYSLRILLENQMRFEDGKDITTDDVTALAEWDPKAEPSKEIAFTPARVVLQDFTGVPAIVDLAAMREAMKALGGKADRINPLSPAELVIDHSIQVDSYGQADSLDLNNQIEFKRNKERYGFLRWGQGAFDNFKVVPPNTGIVHQVNLEHLSRVIFDGEVDGQPMAWPDTLVGTDSHTTMINGLGILGWGVGGIEAEAAMLGQPISMLIPQVIGFKLTGKLPEGTTATDLVLTITEMLREKGVVGKFVEFFGHGLSHLPLADRATIGNMSPEFGSTCAIFPIDEETIRYLELSGRSKERVELVRAYAQAQDLWRDDEDVDPVYSDVVELDLGDVVPSLAGPKRPQDRVLVSKAKNAFLRQLSEMTSSRDDSRNGDLERFAAEGGGTAVGNSDIPGAAEVTHKDQTFILKDGAVVIAAITSCTNTSNPAVMLGAGLLARNAREKGLNVKPWVKTSLAPGSKVVTDYLEKSGLDDDLEALGFYTVGYGCTTCIGNSGPLPESISTAIERHELVACSVLSGNRNFEGRIHPEVKMNYLASPPLVVAYAIAGRMDINLIDEPLGEDPDGNPVYLKDVWPDAHEIQDFIRENVTSAMFSSNYKSVFEGDDLWNSMDTPTGEMFEWEDDSTYVRNPPYFEGMDMDPDPIGDITGNPGAGQVWRLGHDRPYLPRRRHQTRFPGRPLSAGTRHPARRLQLLRLAPRQPRGHDARHLCQRPHQKPDRRGNRRRFHHLLPRRRGHADLRCGHEVPGRRHAAGGHRRQGIRLGFVARLGSQGHSLAGREGRGRCQLRAHSPLQPDRHGCATADLRRGRGCREPWPRRHRNLRHHGPEGRYGEGSRSQGHASGRQETNFKARVRLDTPKEIEYYQNGGILHYVLRDMAKAA